jgi:hypothetical protein
MIADQIEPKAASHSRVYFLLVGSDRPRRLGFAQIQPHLWPIADEARNSRAPRLEGSGSMTQAQQPDLVDLFGQFI